MGYNELMEQVCQSVQDAMDDHCIFPFRIGMPPNVMPMELTKTEAGCISGLCSNDNQNVFYHELSSLIHELVHYYDPNSGSVNTYELLRDEGMEEYLNAKSERIANRISDEFDHHTKVLKQHWYGLDTEFQKEFAKCSSKQEFASEEKIRSILGI